LSASQDQQKSTLSSLPVSQRAELVEYLLSSLNAAAKAEWLALADSRRESVGSN
jgi:hypothetical protein